MRFILFTIAFLVLSNSTSAQNNGEGYELTLAEAIENHPKKILVTALLANAQQQIGKPYKYGGTSPSGFDCSGFLNFIFTKIEMKLPRTSAMIANTGHKISQNEVRVGDLVFFTGSNKKVRSVGHAGIITRIENGEYYFLHASTSSGVREDGIFKNPYFQPRLIMFKRWEW